MGFACFASFFFKKMMILISFLFLFQVCLAEIWIPHVFDRSYNPTFDVGVIIMQGAGIKPGEYEGLALAIQSQFDHPVMIGIPESLFDVPLAFLGASNKIKDIKKQMMKEGLTEDAKIFLIGHSLGGLAVQDFVASHSDFADGLILMGSTILRKYALESDLSLPILSLNGEMDAQFKPTRSAEAFYHHALSRSEEQWIRRSIIIVPGLNHMGPARSSNSPPLVRKNDLRPFVIMMCSFHEVGFGI